MPDPTHQAQAAYTDYRWVQPVHVWLCLTGAWEVDRSPGILIAWRRHHTEWEALVVSASATAPAHGSTPTIRTSWYAAGHVREA